jgi:hypothetical protein
MNYVNFMRKLEGKEPHDTSNSKASGARPLDLQGIIEFTRGLGYPSRSLEARPEFPDHRAGMFWAGYDALSLGTAMGLHSHTPTTFFWAGRAYQQQHGDTHSQQQDTVPVEAEGEYVRSDWVVNRDNVNLDEIRTIIRRLELFSMDNTPSPTQPRAEPEGGIDWRVELYADQREYEQPLRSPLDSEESRVQSVCDERSSRERSPEDTGQSSRYRMERSQRW